MDKDLKQEVGGKAQNIKGRVKEAVGAVTGNKKTEAEGVADRIAGAAREKVAEVKRSLSTPNHRHADETESKHRHVEKSDDE
jgi:uncharacterized protein YjbJ (UPF0337 family)